MEVGGRVSVLVVDDEPTISDVIGRYLARAGYEVRRAGDGETALRLHDERAADLIVLDVALPVLDGFEVLRRLRAASAHAPRVILVTGRDQERDRIEGFSYGADDYVVKPFSPREIVARVDAVMRRGAPAPTQPGEGAGPIVAGALHIDLAGRHVSYDGDPVHLTQMEHDLLVYLASSPGIAHSRERLMGAVWGYEAYSDMSTVTVHVRRLRAKIERQPGGQEFIHTVWGIGYRFENPLTQAAPTNDS